MNRRYRIGSALVAFAIWGAWAFWVNQHAGVSQALRSGLTQGTASFLITLVMVRSVEWLFARWRYPLRLWLAPVLTVSLTGSCLASVHWFAQTPHIASTIALPLAVAFGFCLFTAYRLEQQQQQSPHAARGR